MPTLTEAISRGNASTTVDVLGGVRMFDQRLASKVEGALDLDRGQVT